MCNVTNEEVLPELWLILAGANNVRKCVNLDIHIAGVATLDGSPDHVPILTPELVRKLTTLKFSATTLTISRTASNHLPSCSGILEPPKLHGSLLKPQGMAKTMTNSLRVVP